MSTLIGACGKNATEIRTSEHPVGTRWHATLATPAALVGVVQMRGSAWMARGDKPDETRVEIEVENATPGGNHPWHVHQGQCGSAEAIVGPSDRYKPLQIDHDGEASRSVTLPWYLPKAGRYMVDVHASANNLGAIIACGNFAAPVR